MHNVMHFQVRHVLRVRRTWAAVMHGGNVEEINPLVGWPESNGARSAIRVVRAAGAVSHDPSRGADARPYSRRPRGEDFFNEVELEIHSRGLRFCFFARRHA